MSGSPRAVEKPSRPPVRRDVRQPGPVSISAAPLRRYWWVLVTVALICLAGAALATSATPVTYTGRASLIVSSNDRAPDQDAVLVSGYVNYFDDLAYQRQLLEEADVDSDVTLGARAAAASPILIIEATASDPDDARASASAVARAFQTDINAVRDAERRRQARELDRRIAEAADVGGVDARGTVQALQDQLSDIQDDRVNRLQELQFDGGVSQNSPNVLVNMGLAAFGGLVLGLIAVIAISLPRGGTRRPEA